MTEDLFDDPRLTTMGLLFEAHEGLVAKLEPVWQKYGLSGLDLNAMMRLSRSPGQRLRMSDLAAQTALSTSGVTRLVDRLQRAGLVRRESFPGDRRATYAVLTPDGAERLEQILPDYLATIERWFTGLLTPEQLDGLLTGLRVIRDAVHPDATAHD
ncbi:MarR family winged helix-turn-helix transcriptional regulator [Actinomadura rudentiformis]|uniref:MarR family transcriptional regulator n=1 Tax=Actinomadura rudentiformis TaxID=359158 RepID=A0A6H9YZU6_9ACTN|nr:MarR family transcriptional regulator [Actinomadura rudentiformis]KAB2346093.1 MarR family transcriptional regulator [Actinomadura rudentiformis]